MASLRERLKTAFKNIPVEKHLAYREMIDGKNKKIARVTGTVGKEVKVRAFPETGPVEVVFGQIYIAKDHSRKSVPNGQTRTEVIHPGKPVTIGHLFEVDVLTIKRHIPEETNEQQSLHPEVGSQTKASRG